jgi:hypothetical protein
MPSASVRKYTEGTSSVILSTCETAKVLYPEAELRSPPFNVVLDFSVHSKTDGKVVTGKKKDTTRS